MPEWSTVALNQVVALQRGFDLPESQRRPGPFPVLGSSGISGWHAVGPVPGPGVTIGRSGASIGVTTYYDGPYWPLNTTLFVKDFHDNNPRYIYYMLHNIDFRSFNSGSAQPSLNRNYIANITIKLPPAEVQQSIESVLGAIDDKIVVNDRIASTALDLCSTLFAEALAKDSDLSTTTLGDVAAVNLHKASPIDGCAIRYIDISSVSVDRYEWPKLTAWEEAPSRARRKASAGDVIWSTVRPNRKSRALILDGDPNIIASTGFAVLTPTKVGSAFLYEATRREEFVTYLESVAEGSAYPAVRADRFTKAVIPMLSDSRMAKFESEAMQIHHRIHVARKENRFLAELRDGLLPKLMSGEVRVRDAEKAVEDAV